MWQSQSLEFSSSSIFLESLWVDTKLEKCIWYYIAPNTKKTTILKCGTTNSTTFAVFWWFSTRRSISWFIALEMNSSRWEANSVANFTDQGSIHILHSCKMAVMKGDFAKIRELTSHNNLLTPLKEVNTSENCNYIDQWRIFSKDY